MNIYTQLYSFAHYHLGDDARIDYEKVRLRALEVKPKLIIAGFSSHPRDINYQRFREIADECGALLLCDIAHGIGLKIAGVNNNPFPHAHFVTASTSKTLRGPRAGIIYTCVEEYFSKIDTAVFPGILGAPQNSLLPGLAVAFKYCMTSEYRNYAEQCIENAKALCESLKSYGHKIITGGTDTNIMMCDIRKEGITAQDMLEVGGKLNIIFNGISMKGDENGQGAFRLGTNVITSRGYKQRDCFEVGRYINEIIKLSKEKHHRCIDAEIDALESEVAQFATNFPLPGVTDNSLF